METNTHKNEGQQQARVRVRIRMRVRFRVRVRVRFSNLGMIHNEVLLLAVTTFRACCCLSG
jgi:hypothetical protein